MGQCLFRHRIKTRFFFLLFFFSLNILSNPRRWREEKKRQISHSRGLYSSLLSRGSSRQRESLALLLLFFFFFQRDEPRWRRRRDKSTCLDRENGIKERRVSFVFARVLILARVTLDAIRSRLKRDRAVLATVLDVIKSALESGFRSRYVVIVRNRHQDMSRCFN